MKFNAILIGTVALWGAFVVNAKDVAKIKSPFEPVGSNTASGTFKMSVGNNRAQVAIKILGLVTNTDYQLLIGGVPEVAFNSGSKGAGKFKLVSTSTDANTLLDLDPRGHIVAISDGITNLLELAVAGTEEPTNCSYIEVVNLVRTTNAIVGSAKLAYRLKKGFRLFTVSLASVVPGDYQVYVSGVLRATNTIPDRGKGKLTFSSDGDTNNLPLVFEPRGQPVDIVNNGATVFTGVFEAAATNLTTCSFSLAEAPLLVNANADANAHGYVRFVTEPDCRRDFNVAVYDLDVGTYELWVGSVLRGQLDVQSGNPTEGILEFTTELDDAYKLLLNFDPLGQLIEVKQGGTVYFSGLGPINLSPSNVCEVTTIEAPLFNQGVSGYPDAKGEARFRIRDDCNMDFRIQVQDLPADAYGVYVGGIKVGTIDSGSAGLIEFDTTPDDPNEIPLTFDPRENLVEVRKGSVAILSRVMPVE